MIWRGWEGQLAAVLARTFALRGVLGAVTEDVDLVHGSKGLKQLLELSFWPRARNLSHKHLDGVGVRLVQVLHGPVHLASVAVAGGAEGAEEHQGLISIPRRGLVLMTITLPVTFGLPQPTGDGRKAINHRTEIDSWSEMTGDDEWPAQAEQTLAKKITTNYIFICQS